MREAGRKHEPRVLATALLAAVGVLAVCKVASAILIPIAVAFVLQALFTPLLQLLTRRRVPRALAAALIVGATLGVSGAAAWHLSGPAAAWLEELPRNADDVERKLATWKGPVEEVKRATEKVEKLADLKDEGGVEVSVADKDTLLTAVVDNASSFVVSSAVVLMLLFLLLAHDGSFLLNLVRVLPRLEDKKRATRIVRGFQRDISVYLRTITLINAGLGATVGLALWALGMPSPVLWGAVAGLFNYVPYVGTAVGIVIVGFAAFLTFESPAHAALVPLTYLFCSALEGGVITPAVIGRRLLLSPAVVLVWLLIWSWLWGIAGALLAVPLLMAVKILCEQVPVLAPVAVMLSRGDRRATSSRCAEASGARNPDEAVKTLQPFVQRSPVAER